MLRGLCAELMTGYRRELAALSATMAREVQEREKQIANLEAMAREQDADVAPVEYEVYNHLVRDRDFATTLHDTLSDLTLEFKKVR